MARKIYQGLSKIVLLGALFFISYSFFFDFKVPKVKPWGPQAPIAMGDVPKVDEVAEVDYVPQKSNRFSGNGTDYFIHEQSSRFKTLESIANATLGFEKIFAINLESRYDKNDALALTAFVNDLQIDFQPAVNVSTNFQHLGLPDAHETITIAEKGCARAHMNVWRKMLLEDISTALVFEDDVSMSKHIRENLYLMQDGLLEYLERRNNIPMAPKENDPYMSSYWEYLAVGACQETKPEQLGVMVRYADPHSPSSNNYFSYLLEVMSKLEGKPAVTEHQRFIMPSEKPICTNAYVITQAGAAKLLFAYSRYISEAVDLFISTEIKNKRISSISIVPPIFGQWTVKDGMISDMGRKGRATKQAASLWEKFQAPNVIDNSFDVIKEWLGITKVKM